MTKIYRLVFCLRKDVIYLISYIRLFFIYFFVSLISYLTIENLLVMFLKGSYYPLVYFRYSIFNRNVPRHVSENPIKNSITSVTVPKIDTSFDFYFDIFSYIKTNL